MPDLQALLDPASYAAAPLTIANAIAAAIIFLFGLMILVRGRASLASTLFFTITLASTGWLASARAGIAMS